MCRGALTDGGDSFACGPCAREYAVVLGIPDFRVFPDSYISIEDDRAKAARIAGAAATTGFVGLLEYYWSITEATPRDLAQRFIRHAATAFERASGLLSGLPQAAAPASPPQVRTLELGCRAGGMLAAAAGSHGPAVGIDIALRWLVVADKQLEERGVQAGLVCACAEYLPFPDGSFDVVLAENVLEHVREPARLMSEAHRVLRPGGELHGVTCNRLSLGPEPHVGVWGVGFLPRRLMEPYVQLVRGVPYRFLYLFSYGGLRRLIAGSPFRGGRIDPPELQPSQIENLSPVGQRLARVYQSARTWPVVGSVLTRVGPLLRFRCVRDSSRART